VRGLKIDFSCQERRLRVSTFSGRVYDRGALHKSGVRLGGLSNVLTVIETVSQLAVLSSLRSQL
jgi:hypothetical protein